MHIQSDKTQRNKTSSRVQQTRESGNSNETNFQLQDNRPVSKLIMQLRDIGDAYVSKQSIPIQKKENNTGLPDSLKSGIENLSGYSMDDVKVHYNSSQPAQLNAHAYAQGADIHLASGQEKHLPHEAWHVVQQKQGRVKPTIQMKDKLYVNDDVGLEREANVMGQRAFQFEDKFPKPIPSKFQEIQYSNPEVINFVQTPSITNNYAAQNRHVKDRVNSEKLYSPVKSEPLNQSSFSSIQLRKYQKDAGGKNVTPSENSDILALANWLDAAGFVVQTRTKGEIYVWEENGPEDMVCVDRDHVHICISDSGVTKGLWTAYTKGGGERVRVVLKQQERDDVDAAYGHQGAIDATGHFKPIVEACLAFYGFDENENWNINRLKLWASVSSLTLTDLEEEDTFEEKLEITFTRLHTKEIFFALNFEDVVSEIREAIRDESLEADENLVAILKSIK